MKFPSLGIALLAGLGALAPKGMYFGKRTQMRLDAPIQRFPGERRRAGSNKFPAFGVPPSGSGARERARRQRQWYGSVRF